MLLLRIGLQIVQLRTRGVDEMKRFGTKRPQLAPPVFVPRIVGLAVDVHWRLRGGARCEIEPAPSLDRWRGGDVESTQQGRRQIDRADLRRDSPSGRQVRCAEYERNLNGGVVDE